MENDQIFINEAEGDSANPQWQVVSTSDLSKFPNNCIGYLTTIKLNKEDREKIATGFLISPNLVLTVAHTFQKMEYCEVLELVPDSFSIESREIKIKKFRANSFFKKKLHIKASKNSCKIAMLKCRHAIKHKVVICQPNKL